MAKKNELTLDSLPLVAIDLGSHSIKAMAAISLSPDTLHIMGVETNSKSACIDRGSVSDASSAAFAINQVLQLLANRIHVKELPSAFLLQGGRDMFIQNITCKKDLIRQQVITRDILDKIKTEYIREVEEKNNKIAILDLVPISYTLDGKEQEEYPSPGQMATIIEIQYTAFISNINSKKKLQDSLDQTKLFIEGAFARPDALISALATEDSNTYQNGCAVLDMGAQTTTLSIFKGNQYLANKVVDKGGWNITQAITRMGFNFQTAEQIKIAGGHASPDEMEVNFKFSGIRSIYHPQEECQLTGIEVAKCIQQELDTILQPLLNILKNYEDRIGVLYITGGASKLQGLIPYLQKQTKVSVLFGSHAFLLDREAPDDYCLPDYSALVGALLLAAEHRLNHKQNLPPKKTWHSKLRDKFNNATLDLFTDKNEQE